MMHAHALEISIKLRTKLFKLTCCLLTPAVVYTFSGYISVMEVKIWPDLDAFVHW